MLDAAITPYRAPRWLTRGFSLRNYLVIRFAQRHLALIRRAFPDCAHAEFVAGQPEAFAARLAETLELDGSDI